MSEHFDTYMYFRLNWPNHCSLYNNWKDLLFLQTSRKWCQNVVKGDDIRCGTKANACHRQLQPAQHQWVKSFILHCKYFGCLKNVDCYIFGQFFWSECIILDISAVITAIHQLKINTFEPYPTQILNWNLFPLDLPLLFRTLFLVRMYNPGHFCCHKGHPSIENKYIWTLPHSNSELKPISLGFALAFSAIYYLLFCQHPVQGE